MSTKQQQENPKFITVDEYHHYPYAYRGYNALQGSELYEGIFVGPSGLMSPPCAIIAAVSVALPNAREQHHNQKTYIDWAAYMGSAEHVAADYRQTAEHVASCGQKLPESLARAVFPEIRLAYRV